jgi:hypothetical protein
MLPSIGWPRRTAFESPLGTKRTRPGQLLARCSGAPYVTDGWVHIRSKDMVVSDLVMILRDWMKIVRFKTRITNQNRFN